MNALLQGRYEIIQTLSAGGFGETYVAIDRQLHSQRKVVIKKLKPQQKLNARTYESVRERFEREAAMLESLSEPKYNVRRMYAKCRFRILPIDELRHCFCAKSGDATANANYGKAHDYGYGEIAQ